MKKNDRLYEKVAPMGVNDIMMAVQYQHVARQPLDVPLIMFDGINDATIERGNMQGWAEYTSAWVKDVPIEGDHYFVSTKFKEVGKLAQRPVKAMHIKKEVMLDIKPKIFRIVEGSLTYMTTLLLVQVTEVAGTTLLDIMDTKLSGGVFGIGHSWVVHQGSSPKVTPKFIIRWKDPMCC